MLSSNIILADYRETGIPRYNDNPFIEALPPILEPKSVIEALRSRVDIVYSDKRANPTKRSHLLVGLMNNFFQPIIRHVQLESKLSIMLREGYVGRNLKSGNLAQYLQEGYKRVIRGLKMVNPQASSLIRLSPQQAALTPAVNPVDLNLGDFSYAA